MPASKHFIFTKPKILLLGGTTEAYDLAETLCSLNLEVISSLAGRTNNPRLPEGQWRCGGFGGVNGLVDYLKQENIQYIIDATHPFATKMTNNAVAAAQKTNVFLIRLERPLWLKQVGDNWINAENLEKAAELLPSNKNIFLALGRQHLKPFLARYDCTLIARMIEKPEFKKQENAFQIILAKPGTVEKEKAFLKEKNINLIVARNSGGIRSYSKIEAARALQIPIIMIARAALPQLQKVVTIEEAVIAVQKAFRLSE